MSNQTIGGMQVRQLTGEGISTHWELLGENPYRYRIARLSPGARLMLEPGNVHCLHLYASDGNQVRAQINGQSISENETAWIECASELELHCVDGSSLALLGSLNREVMTDQVKVSTEAQVKRVTKPWGYELWLTGDPSPHFAFKRIFIKAGTKTSLQYHVQKRETNLLLEGQAGLHYNPDLKVSAPEFKPQNTVMTILDPISVIDVFPNRIHRLEAMSDILLCEVSTPELDDVVRITDDSGRRDGRIDSEHKV